MSQESLVSRGRPRPRNRAAAATCGRGRYELPAIFRVLPFLAFSVFTKETCKFTKDFLSLPNPLKPEKTPT